MSELERLRKENEELRRTVAQYAEEDIALFDALNDIDTAITISKRRLKEIGRKYGE